MYIYICICTARHTQTGCYLPRPAKRVLYIYIYICLMPTHRKPKSVQARAHSPAPENTHLPKTILRSKARGRLKILEEQIVFFSRRSCLSISDEYGRRLSNTKIRKSRKKWRNLLDFEHPNGKSSNRAGSFKAPGRKNFRISQEELLHCGRSQRRRVACAPVKNCATFTSPPIPFSACRKSACGTGRRRTI